MNKSQRDLSRIRVKCSVSIIFSTPVFPILQPSLFLTSSSSNPRFFFDPVSQLGDTRVDARLVPTSTALAPAHYTCLEPLPTLLKTCQGSSGVSLVSTTRRKRFLDWVRMCEHDNNVGVKTDLYQPVVILFFPRIETHLACINSSSQESTAEHPGGDLVFSDHITHRVIDYFHRCLLQDLCLLTCKRRTKGSALSYVTHTFIAKIKVVNGLD